MEVRAVSGQFAFQQEMDPPFNIWQGLRAVSAQLAFQQDRKFLLARVEVRAVNGQLAFQQDTDLPFGKGGGEGSVGSLVHHPEQIQHVHLHLLLLVVEIFL